MLLPLQTLGRLLLACLVLLLSACSAGTAPDASLVKSQTWRMESIGQATLADALAASDWQDLPKWKSWGFGPETIWVRLQLRAAEQPVSTSWVVRVRPAFLDYVTLYDPAASLVLYSGDAVPPSEGDLDSINFTLPIPALPQDRTIYLQIRSSSARTMQVEVLPTGQAQRLNRLQEWTVGFVSTASLIFAIWASIQWWTTREQVIGVFALKQVLTTAWAFFMLGFARIVIGPWLPEGWLTAISGTVFSWTVSTTIWFFYTLLQSYQPARLVLRACKALAIITAMLPVMQWLTPAYLMLKSINYSILLAFALLLITLLSALPKQVKQPIPQTVLLVYLLLYSALNSMPPLIHLGWIQESSIVLFGGLAHATLDGMVMFILLQIRARTLQQEQQKTTLDLQRSQEKAEAEKRHREEQSRLFAMLAHEMKTPLAALRMWMDAGQLKPETMERAITDMNSVIERCVHTGQLADQGLQAVWQSTAPLALTQSAIQSCRAPERVDWVAPQTTAALDTDPQMLSIVLSNLLDNACKYGAPGSRIQVSCESAIQDGRAGYRWCVSSQAGPAGLPDTQHLFEKYYRGPQARRLSGSGLGLFLVKGLLVLLQGSIHYEARNDQAVFSVWVPKHPNGR